MITFVYTYYENPDMLAYQYALWANYDPLLREQLKIIIVDDASPNWPAAKVQRFDGLPQLEIYRVKENIPWHQDGARNLGADRADTEWMFCCDMDHLVPETTLRAMLYIAKDGWRNQFYTFKRHTMVTKDLSHLQSFKPAFNIYLLPKRLYWMAGGYDEDMCGCYGTDGPFRARLVACAKHIELRDHIIRVPREIIPDASTTQFERKGPDNARKKQLLIMQKRINKRPPIVTLDFEWSRAL